MKTGLLDLKFLKLYNFIYYELIFFLRRWDPGHRGLETGRKDEVIGGHRVPGLHECPQRLPGQPGLKKYIEGFEGEYILFVWDEEEARIHLERVDGGLQLLLLLHAGEIRGIGSDTDENSDLERFPCYGGA